LLSAIVRPTFATQSTKKISTQQTKSRNTIKEELEGDDESKNSLNVKSKSRNSENLKPNKIESKKIQKIKVDGLLKNNQKK